MYRKLLIAVITAIFSISAIAAQAQPKIEYSSLDEKIPFDPSATKGKLDNGLTYYVKENHKPENRAELQLVVKGGSIDETDDQKGLAHFIEHMCFNGTKHFPKKALENFLESTGMKFGADLNANTGFERTYYLLKIPTDKKNMLDSGFQVLEDWLNYVSFDPEELEKERGVIMEEWRVYRGANYRVMKQHWPKLFYNSKYADRLPIGDTAVIKNAPRERFLDFYNNWYRPDLSAIIAVGDFDKEEVISKIKEKFGDTQKPKNAKEKKEYKIPINEEPVVSIATDKEYPRSEISFYFKHKAKEEGTFRSYKQSRISSLATSMLNDRLSELTHKSPPPFIYSISAESRFYDGLDAFYIIGIINSDGFKSGIEAILKEAFRAKQHGFTESELKRAKKESMRFIQKAYDERNKTKSMQYAMEISRNFLHGEGVPGIEYELALFKKFLPEITLDDVNDFSQKALNKNGLVIAVSAPEKPEIDVPNEKEIMTLYDKVEAMELEPYEDKVSDSELFTKEIGKGKIISEKEIPELGIKELKLTNGAKVILKPTDFRDDEVQFRAYSYGGSSLIENNKDYLSATMASSIIDQSGIADIDIVSLKKLLSGKVVSVSPYIGETTEGIRGNSSTKDIETLFQLINLYFTEPRKDKEAFDSYIAKLEEQLKNRKLSPESIFRDTIQAVTGSYHFREMPLTTERLKEIDYEKAFEIYQQRFSDASDFTFFFVGNFDPDSVRDLIEKYIGSLPSKKSKEIFKDQGVRYPKGVVKKELKEGMADKSSIRLVFTGNFEWSENNKFKFQSMIDALNIILRDTIREEKSGTYGVYAFGSPDKYPKTAYRIDIGFGCDPGRTEELVEALKNVIKNVQKGNFDDSYLKKVKEIAKEQREVNLEKNRFWLNNMYTSYYRKDDLKDIILNYEKRIDNLKKKEIIEAANRYINFDNYCQFILYPENSSE